MEHEGQPYKYKTGGAKTPANVWWDDEESRQVLYGPNGEVLVSKTHRRRIGYFKEGH